MKLFEDLSELGGTIRDAVQKIIKDVYKQELGDSELDEIVNNLSLSDLLELDRAYTTQDVEKIKGVIGPLAQMEYSMGGGRQATSQASNRPAPRQPQGQQSKVEPGTQNTVQTNRNYSSGAQNAVTTKKLDVNDPNAQMDPTEEEPIKESDDAERLAHHKRNLKAARAELRAAKTASEKAHLQQQIQRLEKRIANIENNPIEEEAPSPIEPSAVKSKSAPEQRQPSTKTTAPDQEQAQTIKTKAPRPERPTEEPAQAPAEQSDGHPEATDTASVSDVSFYPDEQPQVATPEEDGRPAEEIKVVDMVKWLKRRAGNDK